MPEIINSHIGDLYLRLLEMLLTHGSEEQINRTGEKTKEIMGVQLVLSDCHQNLFIHPIRNLNYRFLVAEWLWIMAGREDVGTLAYYNSQIAKFSDDGQVLTGSYGKRLKDQWDYLIKTLQADPTSRQAVAGIWTNCPNPSRDIPCTLIFQLLIRGGKLHGIFTMRSSDAWLGIPPDVFSFSQIVNVMAGLLEVEPGSLTMNLGSSHLYEKDWVKAEQVVVEVNRMETVSSPLFDFKIPWNWQIISNSILRDDSYDTRVPPWNMYLKALRSGSSEKCLEVLQHESDSRSSLEKAPNG